MKPRKLVFLCSAFLFMIELDGFGGAEGNLMVPVNHFEPSTSAIPSCLRVSSLLKFVIPNWSANPLRFGLLEPLAGSFPVVIPG